MLMLINQVLNALASAFCEGSALQPVPVKVRK